MTKEDGEELVAAAEDNSGGGLEIKLGGDPIYRAQEGASPEGIGFLGAAIVLLIAFGSLVAAGLPLVIALVGLGISSGGLIALLANVIDVPDWTTAVSGLIGIGVGIDYSLLVLTRFRAAMHGRQGPPRRGGRGGHHRGAQRDHRRLHGRDRGPRPVPHRPPVHVRGRDLRIDGRARRDARLGHAAAGAALLSRPERRPPADPASSAASLKTPKADGESPAARWSHAVQRRPWTAVIVATAVLLALAAPALGMRLGFPDAGNDPPDTMTRQAYDLISEGFGPGANGPLVIAAELPDPRARGRRRRLATRAFAPTSGVDFVAQPVFNEAGDSGADHRDPDHLAAGRGDPGPGQEDRATTIVPEALAGSGVNAEVGGVTARARGPERLHGRPHAALHRRRGRPLLPAPARSPSTRR